MNCLTDTADFRHRLQEREDRIREGILPVPMIERETVKRSGDLVISAAKVEKV